MSTPDRPRPLAKLGRAAKALFKAGLPALGTVLAGPAGGVAAAAIGSLLNVDPEDGDAFEAALATAPPEVIAQIRQIEANVTLAQLETDRARSADAVLAHAADMASDSWLSKNIRPISLAATLAAYLLLVFLAAFLLPLDRGELVAGLVGSVSALLMAQVGFYFGGRTGEKILSIRSKQP